MTGSDTVIPWPGEDYRYSYPKESMLMLSPGEGYGYGDGERMETPASFCVMSIFVCYHSESQPASLRNTIIDQ